MSIRKHCLPHGTKRYTPIKPKEIHAVQFREELADGYAYVCGIAARECAHYCDGYCYADAEDCVDRVKQFHVCQGAHAMDFGYPNPGDYIECLDGGRKKVWPQEVFEATFHVAGEPLSLSQYKGLCDELYYHYVPGCPDLCGWVIKEEDDYLDGGCENIREAYGRDFMAFRSRDDAEAYIRQGGK